MLNRSGVLTQLVGLILSVRKDEVGIDGLTDAKQRSGAITCVWETSAVGQVFGFFGKCA
ncbi:MULTISPECIES: hypothetical protein [Paraburkholderia]|jgi:hypothetical protein|uniref:Uncharacterized protein n=1 Tax=Paraburkholderia strydomiana TaxID=1245417 RepID=A0ABW9C744_9BURK